jgi:hypothetical protein
MTVPAGLVVSGRCVSWYLLIRIVEYSRHNGEMGRRCSDLSGEHSPQRGRDKCPARFLRAPKTSSHAVKPSLPL